MIAFTDSALAHLIDRSDRGATPVLTEITDPAEVAAILAVHAAQAEV